MYAKTVLFSSLFTKHVRLRKSIEITIQMKWCFYHKKVLFFYWHILDHGQVHIFMIRILFVTLFNKI